MEFSKTLVTFGLGHLVPKIYGEGLTDQLMPLLTDGSIEKLTTNLGESTKFRLAVDSFTKNPVSEAKETPLSPTNSFFNDIPSLHRSDKLMNYTNCLHLKHTDREDLSNQDRDELARLIIDEAIETHGNKRIQTASLQCWAQKGANTFLVNEW